MDWAEAEGINTCPGNNPPRKAGKELRKIMEVRKGKKKAVVFDL